MTSSLPQPRWWATAAWTIAAALLLPLLIVPVLLTWTLLGERAALAGDFLALWTLAQLGIPVWLGLFAKAAAAWSLHGGSEAWALWWLGVRDAALRFLLIPLALGALGEAIRRREGSLAIVSAVIFFVWARWQFGLQNRSAVVRWKE